MDSPRGVVIRADRPDSDDGRRLIQRLDEDLRQRYPAVAIHGLHPQDIADPGLTFLVASMDGHAVGCNAFQEAVTQLDADPQFRPEDVDRRPINARLRALPQERERSPEIHDPGGDHDRCGPD